MLCLQRSDTGWNRRGNRTTDADDRANGGENGYSAETGAHSHSPAREANDSASECDASAASTDAPHIVAIDADSVGACCACSDARRTAIHSVADADIGAGIHAPAASTAGAGHAAGAFPTGTIPSGAGAICTCARANT